MTWPAWYEAAREAASIAPTWSSSMGVVGSSSCSITTWLAKERRGGGLGGASVDCGSAHRARRRGKVEGRALRGRRGAEAEAEAAVETGAASRLVQAAVCRGDEQLAVVGGGRERGDVGGHTQLEERRVVRSGVPARGSRYGMRAAGGGVGGGGQEEAREEGED